MQGARNMHRRTIGVIGLEGNVIFYSGYQVTPFREKMKTEFCCGTGGRILRHPRNAQILFEYKTGVEVEHPGCVRPDVYPGSLKFFRDLKTACRSGFGKWRSFTLYQVPRSIVHLCIEVPAVGRRIKSGKQISLI